MMAYHFPLDAATDAVVRERVAERVRARSAANVEAWRYLPGMNKKTGAERLAFYRSTSPKYWAALAASSPGEAHAMILDWGQLVRRYGGVPQAPIAPPSPAPMGY